MMILYVHMILYIYIYIYACKYEYRLDEPSTQFVFTLPLTLQKITRSWIMGFIARLQ